MENEIIDKLKRLGFKEYESKVFVALLQGHAMSASEIAKESKVIRNSIYDILKSFVEKGYCNEIETNSILKYELIDPDIIFDKIKRELKREREQEDKNLRETLSKLKPLHKAKAKKQEVLNVELIRGYNKHREKKFLDLLKSAKKEILFMMKFEGYVTDEIDNSTVKFFSKGGVIKSVYEYTLDFKVPKNSKWIQAEEKDLLNILSKYQDAGEQLRISDKPVPNFTIFDRETVFMCISDKSLPRHQEADLIIRNKQFAENLIHVFNTYYENSKTVKDFNNNTKK
jgi:sugar-specific transcriptional regulator TrmB